MARNHYDECFDIAFGVEFDFEDWLLDEEVIDRDDDMSDVPVDMMQPTPVLWDEIPF